MHRPNHNNTHTRADGTTDNYTTGSNRNGYCFTHTNSDRFTYTNDDNTVVAIDITNFAFVPDTVAISKGTIVVWTEQDSGILHIVTGTGFDVRGTRSVKHSMTQAHSIIEKI